jgi:hypothetical protein
VSKSLRLNDRRPTRWIEDRTRLLEKIAPDCVSYAETRFDAPVFTLQGVGFKDSSLATAPTISVYVDQVPRIRPWLAAEGCVSDVSMSTRNGQLRRAP